MVGDLVVECPRGAVVVLDRPAGAVRGNDVPIYDGSIVWNVEDGSVVVEAPTGLYDVDVFALTGAVVTTPQRDPITGAMRAPSLPRDSALERKRLDRRTLAVNKAELLAAELAALESAAAEVARAAARIRAIEAAGGQ